VLLLQRASLVPGKVQPRGLLLLATLVLALLLQVLLPPPELLLVVEAQRLVTQPATLRPEMETLAALRTLVA
jgi:hypothetical protein